MRVKNKNKAARDVSNSTVQTLLKISQSREKGQSKADLFLLYSYSRNNNQVLYILDFLHTFIFFNILAIFFFLSVER